MVGVEQHPHLSEAHAPKYQRRERDLGELQRTPHQRYRHLPLLEQEEAEGTEAVVETAED